MTIYVMQFVGITVSALFISRIGRVNLQVVCYGLGTCHMYFEPYG